jgi:hypothetical protein
MSPDDGWLRLAFDHNPDHPSDPDEIDTVDKSECIPEFQQSSSDRSSASPFRLFSFSSIKMGLGRFDNELE